MRAGGPGRRRKQGGSILVETVLAVLILTAVGVSLMGMIQKSMIAALKARERATCGRMAQTGFARLKNIDYYKIFTADSSSPDYGLQAAYPYRGVLDGLRATLGAARFDRFRVAVSHVRRDASDSDGDGHNTDLVPFSDGNVDLADDFDSNIRFFDQNGDGDFFDTFVSAGRTVAEQPDTHIKLVTFEVYRRGRLACSQTEYISLEQFTGDTNPSSEASLSLLVSTPVNAGYGYGLVSAGQSAAWNLPISKPYPQDSARYRADAAAALVVEGETDPLANVDLYVGDSGVLTTAVADALGHFWAAAGAVTAALIEGENTLRARAAKDGYVSALTQRSLLLDVNPPSASGATPAGAVGTRSPYVAIALSDSGLTTTTVSGICPDVITLRADGQAAAFEFEDGVLVWVDSATGTSPVLSTGSHVMVAEAGDYAGYKTSATWSFSIVVPATDNSAPAVSNKNPIGNAPSSLPEISVRVEDQQSGIIPSSIVLRLDGAVVVGASNVGSHYDAATGNVRYVPASPFDADTFHTVEVTVSHWADDPADKVTSVDSWTFHVP